jgi:hypothetical protein
MTMNHQAIYKAYPNVVAIYEDRGAFDTQGNKVQLDQSKVDAAAIIVAQEQALNYAQKSRASAYQQEADPLFFKYQRGEVTKEEWESKIEEIRQRFPYPEGGNS